MTGQYHECMFSVDYTRYHQYTSTYIVGMDVWNQERWNYFILVIT
jgi:hypothetical protein